MSIRDSVTSWSIQNIVLPNAEDMRNRGHIISRFLILENISGCLFDEGTALDRGTTIKIGKRTHFIPEMICQWTEEAE